MKTFTLSGLRLRPALISALACLLLQGAASAGFSASAATPRNAGKVYVDKSGRMRLSSDRSDARYYGVNYTVPFAHAYRALDTLGINHHSAIDRDVYHMARLGLNAFRLHLWDVELTDSLGNLLDNEHLELLDYLIESLDVSTIPDQWGRSKVEKSKNAPFSPDALLITLNAGTDTLNTVLTKYVKDIIQAAYPASAIPKTLKIRTGSVRGSGEITAALVNADGITYDTTATLTPDTTVEIPLSSLSISPTLLCPAPYPVFLQRQLMPEGYDKPLDVSDIERLQLSFPGSEAEIELIGAWLE